MPAPMTRHARQYDGPNHIFWNGTGLNLLSELERDKVEPGDRCRAGIFEIRGNQCYVDAHVVGTIADPNEEPRPSLAARIGEDLDLPRAADGGTGAAGGIPPQLVAEMLAELKNSRATIDRVMEQRDGQAQKVADLEAQIARLKSVATVPPTPESGKGE